MTQETDLTLAAQRPDRPARPAGSAARAPGTLIAAVDIGGTKIAGALLDADGTVLDLVLRQTPARAASDTILRTVHDILDALAAHPEWARVDRLGICSAGPVHVDRGAVSPVNIPAWRDFPLLDRVAEHPAAAGLPMVLVGDGVAMAAGEHWLGAARGFANALCLVVSTGVGAGLVLNGAVRPGPTGNAGHLGHICVDMDGEPCPCGSRGCLEGVASGTAIAQHAWDAGWRPLGPDASTNASADTTADPTDNTSTGEPTPVISAAAVAESARAGDPIALAAFDRAARALAAAIASVAVLLEIEVAVVGGGVAQSGDLLFAPLRKHLATYAALPFARGIEVRPALLGSQAGLVGAAALAATSATTR